MMNEGKLDYRNNALNKTKKDETAKGKARQIFGKFRTCAAAGVLGLAIMSGIPAAAYGKDVSQFAMIEKHEKKELTEQLLKAVEKGQKKKVKDLLHKGADVNGRNENGMTALMLAAEKGDLKIVKLLIEEKADVNAKTKDGWTALEYAAVYGRTKTVEILLNKGANIGDALRLAAYWGHTKTVKLLLDKGADVDAKTKDGRTALLSASSMGNAEIVKLLLDKGADVDAKDEGEWTNGWTALKHAAVAGHPEVVKILLNAGADVNTKDENGSTVLAIVKTHYCSLEDDFMGIIGLDDDIDTEVAIEYLKYEMVKYEGIIKLLEEHGAKE